MPEENTDMKTWRYAGERTPEAPGWQLVPKEPDIAMASEGYLALQGAVGAIALASGDKNVVFNLWKAMLSTAPSAPSVDSGVSERNKALNQAIKECHVPEPECCGAYVGGNTPDEPQECCGSPEPRPRDASEIAAAIEALRYTPALPVADARNEGIEEALKKIKSYVLIEDPDNFPVDAEIMASEIWAIIRPLFPELKSPPAEGAR